MRKLLFLFVVTMLSVTAMAQDVIYDKTNDAGVRTVGLFRYGLGSIKWNECVCGFKRDFSIKVRFVTLWL